MTDFRQCYLCPRRPLVLVWRHRRWNHCHRPVWTGLRREMPAFGGLENCWTTETATSTAACVKRNWLNGQTPFQKGLQLCKTQSSRAYFSNLLTSRCNVIFNKRGACKIIIWNKNWIILHFHIVTFLMQKFDWCNALLFEYSLFQAAFEINWREIMENYFSKLHHILSYKYASANADNWLTTKLIFLC